MRRMILIALLASTGCNVVDRVFGRDELTVLRRNQGRWRALGITNYDFTYRQMCFCQINEPSRIAVRNGLVTSVTSITTNQPVVIEPYSYWPTIDSLFARTERNIRSGYNLDITYDGTYHFPGRVVGDIPMAVDDEYTAEANSLVRVPQ